jgi:hypothetical protein
MPVYVVHVTVHTGDYEKTYEKLVEAPDSNRAEYDALWGETHNTDDAPSYEDWSRTTTEWWDDCMVYTAYVHKELDINQVAAIKDVLTIR